MKKWIVMVAAVVLVALVGCGRGTSSLKMGQYKENDFEKIAFTDYFFCETYDGVDEEELEKELRDSEAGLAGAFAFAVLGSAMIKLEDEDGNKWLIVSCKFKNKSDKEAPIYAFSAEVKFNNSSPIKGKCYVASPFGITDIPMIKVSKDDEEWNFVAAFSVPEKVAKKWKRGTVKIGIDSDDAKMVTLPPDKLARCYSINIEH